MIARKAAGYNVLGNPRPAVTAYVAQHQINEGTYPSLAVLVRDIAAQVDQYGSLAKLPAAVVGNTRNDMYLVSEAIRFLMKDKENDLNKEEVKTLNAYKGSLDRMEAHRRHGRREDRQDPPHLRPGRLRRDHGRRDDRRR